MQAFFVFVTNATIGHFLINPCDGRAYAASMSRYPRTLFGPAGVCDACGRCCCTLNQAGAPGVAGIRCYHCGRGRFRHRSEWTFAHCPACRGARCGECHYTGIVATPHPDALPVD